MLFFNTLKNFFTGKDEKVQQPQRQQPFKYNPNLFQPSTKLKDWIGNDLPNELSTYKYINHQPLHNFQEQIQYNLLQGTQFSQFKEKGNEIYQKIIKKCQIQGVPINQLKTELQQALNYYQAANNKAQTQGEKASIQKNIATINFKLLLYNCQPGNQVEYFKQGLTCMKKAIEFARRENKKSNDWYTQLEYIKSQAIKETLNSILNQKTDQTQIIEDLRKLAKDISLEMDSDSHLIIQKQIFQIMEKIIQDCKQTEEYIKAENIQENVNLDLQLLYEASQISKNEKIRFYFNERYHKLGESVQEFQAIKYLQLGNKIHLQVQEIKIQISSYKLINSEAIWEAIDAYKAAIKLFEGKFLHIEAECYFMIGQIYLEMFDHTFQKAHDCIRNSISLVLNSCQSVSKKQWYQAAENTMKQLQNKSVENDFESFLIWKGKNDVIVDEIALYQSKGLVDFVKWVIIKHKPSFSQDFKIENKESLSDKKLLLKVMPLYHGDKITGETQHFKFIAKEIMIHLTNFFEQVK